MKRKELKVKAPNLPEKFLPYLGKFGVQFVGSSAGLPTAWGYKITRHLGEELWSEISAYGDMECDHGYPTSEWFLITRRLEIEDAIKLYGEITRIKVGPKGGFQSVTFGDLKEDWRDEIYPAKFGNDNLNPLKYLDIDWKTDPRVEKDPPSRAMLDLAKRNRAKKLRRERAKAKKVSHKTV